jgi:DNA-binding response OmpR family regulator
MAASPGRVSILVVDDEPPIRRLLLVALEAEGYAVRTAPDGESALLATRDSMPGLIVLDLGLPGMSGDAFLRLIRSDGLDVPVIVVSAKLDGPAVAARAGANAYLSKPFDLWELMNKIADLTDGPPASEC